MRPKYVAKLPMQLPSVETNSFGGSNVSRGAFTVYAGRQYPEAKDLMQAVETSQIIKEWAANEKMPISADYETANYLEIRRRPKTYFGKYIVNETVYLETIEQQAEADMSTNAD